MGNSHQNLPSYTYGALMPIGLGIALGLLIVAPFTGAIWIHRGE